MHARIWRDDSGQALAFSVVALSVVLLLLAMGVAAATCVLSARAALSKGATAAALADLGQAQVVLDLRVTYATYTCDRRRECGSFAGQTDVAASDGTSFTRQGDSGFGPIPGWAAAAGCIGTVWPGAPMPAGEYRICTGQQVVGARLIAGDQTALRGLAEQWLDTNVRADRLLRSATVTAVDVGTQGEVTVQATGEVRSLLPFLRTVRVSETAWAKASV